MKLKKSKIAIIASLVFSLPVWMATGCGHPAYKLKSGESSKVRLIEKDGKLVKLEVKQDGVTEIDSSAKADTTIVEKKEETQENKSKSVIAEAKNEPETENKSRVENKSEAKDKPESENKSKSKDKPEIKDKPKSESKSKVKDKSEAKDKPKSENKSKAKDKTKKKNKPEAGDKTAEKDKAKEKPKTDEKQKPAKGKKKVWVPAVYKVVKHPAKKKQEISVHWVCQCGEIFYSDEEWQAHRPNP